MDRYTSNNTGKFAFSWSNNANGDAKMQSKTLRLPSGTLTCKELFVDRISMVMKPNAAILRFDSPDHPNATWKAETQLLYLRLAGNSTAQHPVYVYRDGADTQNYPSQMSNYSQSFTIESDVQGDQDYWATAYKPIRDYPIATDVNQMSEIDLTILFPMFGMNLPDYRVDTVLIEFSYTN